MQFIIPIKNHRLKFVLLYVKIVHGAIYETKINIHCRSPSKNLLFVICY